MVVFCGLRLAPVYGEEKSFKTGKGAEFTTLNGQMVTEGSTVLKVTGQAQNTGTKLLTNAQIGVNFKDASGHCLDQP